MKCPNCGAEVGNHKACEFCGTQISVSMQKEQEQINKQGCPKCKSTNVEFSRENQGEFTEKNSKRIIRKTVGFCKDCGYTWYPDGSVEEPKKNNTLWWVLGWLFFFPAPVMILIWRKKNTWDTKIKLAVTAVFWIVLIVICSSSDSSSTTPTDTESTEVKSVVQESTEDNPVTSEINKEDIAISEDKNNVDSKTLYGGAEIVNMMSGSGKNVIGTITVSHADQAECTEEALSEWYMNYVKKNTDSKYHVIIYNDKPNLGVYANGMGFIQKDIELSKEPDGTYKCGDDAGSTYYTVSEDGSLSIFSSMADASIIHDAENKIDAIIPKEYKMGEFYEVDVAGPEGALDCNLILINPEFSDMDCQKIALELAKKVQDLKLGIGYFSISFQSDDYTLNALSSVDLSEQDASEITTMVF